MCITIMYDENKNRRRDLYLVTISIMVFATRVSIYHVTNLTDAFAQESDNKRMFTVNVNLVGGLNSETNTISFDTVDIYVEKYPQ